MTLSSKLASNREFFMRYSLAKAQYRFILHDVLYMLVNIHGSKCVQDFFKVNNFKSLLDSTSPRFITRHSISKFCRINDPFNREKILTEQFYKRLKESQEIKSLQDLLRKNGETVYADDIYFYLENGISAIRVININGKINLDTVVSDYTEESLVRLYA